MIECFFRGYGCWFYYHRRSGQTYTITNTIRNKFLLCPATDKEAKLRNWPSVTIGFFNLMADDALTYKQTKKQHFIKKLTPSTRYEQRNTIEEITQTVMIGGMLIEAEDCYFMIDKTRPFILEFEFYALNESTDAIQAQTIQNDSGSKQKKDGYTERDNIVYGLIKKMPELLKMRRGEIHNTLKKEYPALFTSGFPDWWKRQAVIPKSKTGRPKKIVN